MLQDIRLWYDSRMKIIARVSIILAVSIIIGCTIAEVVDGNYYSYQPGGQCNTSAIPASEVKSTCYAIESPYRDYGWPYKSKTMVEGNLFSKQQKIQTDDQLNASGANEAYIPGINTNLPLSGFVGNCIVFSLAVGALLIALRMIIKLFK